MSYQVLARKWRPRTFCEMVGQAHVLKALVNALDNQRLHHAYLFTGTRGVGKTTLARIIAKCLNCEAGISSTPCGQCPTCRAVDEGRFVDLIEVDAASRTKVEDTRELLENVQYAPTCGRYKVYLIDEVHMLSTHSFNALLKTLEEPPPHVKFLLATTDPQKLPITILSRCLQFSLKALSPERIVEHLSHVLQTEGVSFEDEALWLLGRAAGGSMRDALTLTDQAIAFGEGPILSRDIRAMLGSLDHQQVYTLLQALFSGDARALLLHVQYLSESGPDWQAVLAEILTVLHRMAIAQLAPEALDNALGDRAQLLELAEALPAEDVQFYYQMALMGRRDLPLAPDLRSGFEMVLLRMLAFRPAGGPVGPQKPLKQVEASLVPVVEPNKATDAAFAVPESAEQEESTAPQATPQKGAEILLFPSHEALATAPVSEALDTTGSAPSDIEPEPQTVLDDELDDTDPVMGFEDNYFREGEACFEELLDEHSAPTSTPEAAEEFSGIRLAASPATGLAADWIELLPKLELAGLTANIAANCTLVSKTDDCWLLQLDPAQGALFNAAQQERLNAGLNRYLGNPVCLEIRVENPAQETPAQALARARLLRQRQAEQSIQNDPCIQQLISQFSAEILEHTIEPTIPR